MCAVRSLRTDSTKLVGVTKPDTTQPEMRGFSYWKIKHGIRWTGMPSWKATLTDQQIWSLALFLRHMDKLPPAAEQAWQNVVN
jgi:thiosulfate dehydrogenase